MKIIFNADDLGLSKGVNDGILHCYKNGIVSSASFLTTTDYFEDTVALIKSNELANIGLHFNLTEGKPILKNHQSLVSNDGLLQRNIHLSDTLNLKEVYYELEAQFLKATNAGIKITHIDSHHHVHMSEKLVSVFIQFSKKYKLPLRKINNTFINPIKITKFYAKTFLTNYYTNQISLDFYDKFATAENLQNIIKNRKKGTLEIMCHPGFLDPENGSYNEQRLNELEVLTNFSLKI
jgi:predicted glycoside hydrolase/deacetylase ChbG (UPF0249 family)